MDKLVIRGRDAPGEIRFPAPRTPPRRSSARRSERRAAQDGQRAALQAIATMVKLLRQMGVAVERDGRMHLDAREVTRPRRPTSWSRPCARRSWCWAAGGALRQRPGLASGGCAIGARPVDQHIKGREALGATVDASSMAILSRASALKGRASRHRRGDGHRHRNLMMAPRWPRARR